MRAIAILEKKIYVLGVGLSWKRTMNMQIYKYMHESSPEKNTANCNTFKVHVRTFHLSKCLSIL